MGGVWQKYNFTVYVFNGQFKHIDKKEQIVFETLL